MLGGKTQCDYWSTVPIAIATSRGTECSEWNCVTVTVKRDISKFGQLTIFVKIKNQNPVNFVNFYILFQSKLKKTNYFGTEDSALVRTSSFDNIPEKLPPGVLLISGALWTGRCTSGASSRCNPVAHDRRRTGGNYETSTGQNKNPENEIDNPQRMSAGDFQTAKTRFDQLRRSIHQSSLREATKKTRKKNIICRPMKLTLF